MTPVLDQPLIQIEVVVLLGPEHPRQRLAVHAPFIFVQRVRRNPLVEFVRVGDPAVKYPLETAKGIVDPGGRQTQADGRAAAAGHVEDIVGRRLGPDLGGVDRLAVARDEVRVERILDIRGRIGLAPETGRITLILGEEQLWGALAMQPVVAQLRVCGLNGARPHCAERRLRLLLAPRPGVAEPEGRQDPQPGRFRPAIVHGNADEDVFRALLRVLHEHVKIPVVVEDAGIEQLVLKLFPRASPVRFDQVPVRILPLRVLVEILHVRVRGRAVEVEVVLLDILAMVPLAVGEPEQALFQDRVPLVPQRQRKAQPLLVIAEAPEPVLAPPVGS